MGTCCSGKSQHGKDDSLSVYPPEMLAAVMNSKSNICETEPTAKLKPEKTLCNSTELKPGKTVSDIETDISLRGLSLEALRMIAEDIKDSRMNCLDKTQNRSPGEQIVFGHVKPRTLTNNCSYFEYLYQDPSKRHLLGKCNAFLCHPWMAEFEDTLAALCAYEDKLPIGSPPQFYFIDYFAVNQHHAEEDLEQLAGLVQKCSTLVLMAKPWEKPMALTRIWCIFELANAALGNTKIVLILPPNDERRFQSKMRENVCRLWTFVDELFSHVDSKSAKAFYESDAKKIKMFIKEQLGGFMKVDTLVADALRYWFLSSIKTLIESFPNTEKGSLGHASLLFDVASFYFSQALYDNAALLYKEAEDIYREKNISEKWIACQYNRIRMLTRIGKFDDTLRLSIMNVKDSTKLLGEFDSQTLDSKKLLGDTYRELRKLPESEKILREVLEVHQKREEPMSYLIIISMVSLAETLREARKLEEAANMVLKVINARTEEHGRSSPITLNSVSKYARCLALSGKLEIAIPLFREALPILRLNYGAQDMNVKNCETWLHEALAARGAATTVSSDEKVSRRPCTHNL